MQQIWIPKIGPPSVLELRSAPDPEPGKGQVRIRVEAAGVNFADLMARMGIYPDAPKLPAVVGYEVAGQIDAIGESVDSDWLHKPVVAMTRFGGYSSSVIVDLQQVAQRPAGMSAALGAAVPVTGLTAWMMLEVMGRIRAGDRVLVHSAGGGVGLMALDLILRRKAHAFGTASSPKHKILLELGYERVVDARQEEYARAFRSEPGFDLILDPVGGRSWKAGLNMLRAGGRLVCFGFSANAVSNKRSLWTVLKNMRQVPWLSMNPITLMNRNQGVLGVNMGHLWHERDRVREWLQDLMQALEAGEIRPRVHAEVAFSDAAEAHRILHDRENLGKVVLVPDEAS